MDQINPKEYFFIPFDEEEFFLILNDVIINIPEIMQSVGKAYIHNLKGALLTISIPFYMASTSACDRRFEILHLAEMIRSGERESNDKIESLVNKKF